MPLPTLGDLDWISALDHPELLAPTTHARLAAWAADDAAVAGSVAVAAIDPSLADTAAFVAAYRVPMAASVNCVVIQGRRGEAERIAAAAVRADTRADVNGVIKRLLDVRKCSFLGLDAAVARSGMEYGGITPVGLPDGWRILVDGQVPALPAVVIGSGVRGSKLLLPGKLLASYPGVEVIDGLASPSSPAGPAAPG
jgi:prolyl-tRNA editing enzyme YbaK/EbsC (Cys-tRNA(Pro) deacylase)